MTAGEKLIADRLLLDDAPVEFFSVSDLSAEAGTSESTIVRFSRRLGYSGFTSFRKAWFSEMVAKSQAENELTYQRLTSNDSINDVRRKVFALMKGTLEDTINDLSPEAFDEATRRIASARRVQAFGNNESGNIVQTAIHKFLLLGVDMTVHTEYVLHKLHAQHLGKQDLSLILSHSGEAKDLIEAQRVASKRGAHTLSITSNADSTLARESDTHLLTSLPITSVGDEAGVIRITQIAVLDCLAAAVAHFKSKQGGGEP